MTKRGRPRDAEVGARIVEATRQLLRAGGLEAVTVSAVAEHAGVSRPAVYRRYANTDDLAMAVLHADLERHLEAVRAGSLPEGVEDYLVALGTHFFDYYAERRRFAQALLQRSVFAPPPWQGRFAEQAQRFLGGVVGDLEARKARGGLHPDVDCAVIAQAFFATYLTVAIGGVTGTVPSVEAQRALLRAVMHQHLQGLVVSP